ncbi:MAG TPA: hypothetical protein VFA98_00895 [Thermoanaerobaculia bacterium]|jgi:hypothetical protein|nr:hypothetical protein [Thermoanaerobaculia bacterium]
MQHLHGPIGFCECGRPVVFRQADGSGVHREIACECGRRHDVEYGSTGWVAVAQLTPERSLPLSGFSIPLRQKADAERFRFSFPLHGDAELPVHILFSRSEGRAEVKAADLKVFSVHGVRRPTDARRRWIAWWREGRPSMGAVFPPPRRVGRLPVPRTARRPALAPAR